MIGSPIRDRICRRNCISLPGVETPSRKLDGKFPYSATQLLPPKKFRRVHEANSAQHQPTGAKYLAGGFNNATALSGASPANRVVLLQFESIDKAKAWYADGQAKREKKLGGKVASSFRILAIEGVNQ